MSGERILIVDDEPQVRRVCTQALRGKGYRTQEASTGQEALAQLEKEAFDLLLLDLMLADMDGLTLLHRARELAPDLIAVIVTGYGTLENAIEALRTGARDFLLKPFQPDDLVSTVGEALALRQREQETALLRAQLPILEIGQTLMAEGKTGSMPGHLLEVVARQMRAARALLILLDEEGANLHATDAFGFALDEALQTPIRREESLVGQGLLRQEPLVLDGEVGQDPLLRVLATAQQDIAIVCTPLHSRGRAIGVLALAREARIAGQPRAAFSVPDLNLLSILAGQAAVSLENAQLYEKAQREIGERRQVEAALGLSEEKFAKAFRSSPDPITITDLPSGRYIEVNDSFLKATGYEREEIIGRTTLALDTWVDPEHRNRFVQALQQQGSVRNLETRMRSKSGSIGVVLMSSEIIHLDGKPCVLTVSKDITDSKRAEEALARRANQLSLINEIGSQIASVLALDRVLDTAARLVQEAFGYHHVALFTLDRNEGALVMKARAGAFTELFPLDHRLELGQGLVGWAALQGKTGLANDVSRDSRYVNLYPEVIPTHSELSVPIQIGGETVGILDVQSPELDAFDQDDVMVLETVSDQVAVAIENARLYETVRRELVERRRAEEELRESEERYRALFEQANDAILLTNEHDAILDANQRACELWGYSRGELLTMQVGDLQAPAARRPRGGVIRDELAEHGSIPFESLDIHRDGTCIPVEVSNARLAGTHPELVLSIVRDITERKRAEEALRSAEREKETILDSLVEHVLHEDAKMKILWANRAACESAGLTRDELLGRYCYEIWPQQDAPCSDCPVLEAMETGLPAEIEKETPDGRAWFIRGYPEFGEDGEVIGGIEVTLEVTERRQAEEALRLSEARYRGFVEQSYEGVWEIDHVGVTTFANTRLAQILGYDGPEQMIGRKLADFAPKAEPGLSLPWLRGRRATGLEALDCMLQREDGSMVYAILSALPHVDEAGAFDGATLFVTDITDRRQMEEALRQSEHRYRTLFESAGDAILISDPAGRLLAANQLACQRLGYSQEELLRMHLADIEPPEYAALLPERIEELQRYGHTVFETTHVRRDGTTIPIEVGSRLIEYEGEMASLSIARDLTERKQMEQAMLRTERLSAMGHLAAALAHEINNPLQSIGNCMELVLDFPLGEAERQEYLEAVRQEINRLMTLATRVLDFARPPRLERRLSSVAETVQYALTLAGKQLAHSRIGISRDLPKDLPPVLASHDQLAQVFLNLIINAIDAMPDGGKLSISARTTAEQIELSFTDSGPGLSADSLDKLFEPFHTTKEEGTGLGLAVSYSIIQQHGGTIQAGNGPDGGAVFTVCLPPARVDDLLGEETDR